eukprot:ctg_6382.g664
MPCPTPPAIAAAPRRTGRLGGRLGAVAVAGVAPGGHRRRMAHRLAMVGAVIRHGARVRTRSAHAAAGATRRAPAHRQHAADLCDGVAGVAGVVATVAHGAGSVSETAGVCVVGARLVGRAPPRPSVVVGRSGQRLAPCTGPGGALVRLSGVSTARAAAAVRAAGAGRLACWPRARACWAPPCWRACSA